VEAVAALHAGLPVLLPTDGVYGLCCAVDEVATERLYELKGRDRRRPTAIVAASLDALVALIPELDTSLVLPGPFTSVVPNPAHRFRWLTGETPDAIGVRLPELPAVTQRVLDEVGAVVATSANDPGEPAAASLDEVPGRIRRGCAAEVDAGPLPGTPSTVVDFTGPEPVVLRQGAGRWPRAARP
jgi:L-threonylcarbamoyladenylate synthase